MSGNNSRTVRRAQAGTTEAPWVRYTLITVALAFMLLVINALQAWQRRHAGMPA